MIENYRAVANLCNDLEKNDAITIIGRDIVLVKLIGVK